VKAIPSIGGKVGAPLRKPRCVVADRGYDSDGHRMTLACRNIRTLIARRRTDHGSNLGRLRWPIERTISWLHQFKRLRVRYERRADIHESLTALACSIICWRRLKEEYF
jgi:transposase